MRIATWNVNGLRARLDFVLQWLDERRPDVVGLQELKLADDDFPHDVFAERGYQAAVHGQKAWNGVAILARETPENVERGLPGEAEQGARLIKADVGGLTFVTAYVPNGKDVDHEDFPAKLEWLDALVEHWRERYGADVPAVLCGDFNIAPADLDSHHEDGFEEGIFHTPEERLRLERLIDSGLVDLFRALRPEEQAFSWWDYRGGAFHRGLGLRIDLLLATEAVHARVGDVVIEREWRKKKDGLTASDHAPVYADLEDA